MVMVMVVVVAVKSNDENMYGAYGAFSFTAEQQGHLLRESVLWYSSKESYVMVLVIWKLLIMSDCTIKLNPYNRSLSSSIIWRNP